MTIGNNTRLNSTEHTTQLHPQSWGEDLSFQLTQCKAWSWLWASDLRIWSESTVRSEIRTPAEQGAALQTLGGTT